MADINFSSLGNNGIETLMITDNVFLKRDVRLNDKTLEIHVNVNDGELININCSV